MTQRHIYIDVAPGEARGVVALDGRPERLLIARDAEPAPLLGERYRARVVKIDRGSGLALLDLGQGQTAALRLKPDRKPPIEGQTLEVEIAIEPQGGKAAVARADGPAEGPVGPLSPPPSLAQRLAALVPGQAPILGERARQAADQAEDEALAVEHVLPGGGSIAVETTRALTAVDVDLGAGGARDAKRAARQANLQALATLGRLLRLKALGGLVVIDLVGRGHDGPALSQAAQMAFAADQPGVIVGPITRFGTLELALPRRHRPVQEILCGADGRPTGRTLALRLLRAVEGQGRADPGGRLIARCAPEVAQAALPLLPDLAGIIGARFEVVPDPDFERERLEVASR
jgi:Ribonuclease G/E